jgi:hypothetical protein
VLLCKLTGEIRCSYDEYRLVRSDVTAVCHCAAGGCFCTIVPEYLYSIKRTFLINFVIVVKINHILSEIYWKINESSGDTSGCNEELLPKIHNFQRSHTSTKDANMLAISMFLRAHTFRKF